MKVGVLTGGGDCPGLNAVIHAGGGTTRIYGDPDRGKVSVFVEDHGAGIDLSHLPHATLERGYSTGGVGIGHGFWLMLQTVDCVFLLTGSTGTTVVLEQGKMAPQPDWLGRSEAGSRLRREPETGRRT